MNLLWRNVTNNYPELKKMIVEFHRFLNKARMTKDGKPRIIRRTTFEKEYIRLTNPTFTEQEIMDAFGGGWITKTVIE